MRRRMIPLAALACVALMAAPSTSVAQQQGPRYALVVGNADYADLSPLRNSVNDAKDMREALESIGFQVDLIVDADLASMEDAVVRLGSRLSGSADSVGFFFYAGHGVQSSGVNYLIPADARIAAESFLRSKAVSAQSVLDTLQAARNKLNIVVLDACRDNPFSWGAGRGGARGLNVLGSQPPGSIVVYATSAGLVAQDGSGRNGTFTAELLKNLKSPGIEVKDMFNRTGAGVQSATGGKQIPAVYNQFFGNAYLGGQSPPPQVQASIGALPGASQGADRSSGSAEIVVTADQDEAEVWIDNTKMGMAPNIFQGLPAGREILVEARKGSYRGSERITLKAGETREIALKLSQARGNLFLQVPGAASYRLWLDGADKGSLGSGLVKELSAGNHDVELRGEGMHWKGRVEVKAPSSESSTTTVKISPWEVGTIVVDAPADATVKVSPASGSAAGSAAPPGSKGHSSFERLPVGSYVVEASGPGYETYKSTVSLSKGENKSIVPWRGGTLVVSTSPSGASVSVNGVSKGRSPVTVKDLPAGYANVTVSAPDYEEYSQRQLVELGKTTQASYVLRKKSGPAPTASAPSSGSMVLVRGGTFSMGSAVNEAEKPVHDAKVSDFYLAKFEVTVGDFARFVKETLFKSQAERELGAYVMKDGSWSKNKEAWWREASLTQDDRHPVVCVSWFDALEYCNWLSKKEGLQSVYTISDTDVSADWSRNGYRLPTEAEWEYAARGGSLSRGTEYPGSDDADRVCWDLANSGNSTRPVGSKAANELGLFDMGGNVREWCWDLYGPYADAAGSDYRGASSGTYRSLRGGSWSLAAARCTVSYRDYMFPSNAHANVGFRLARSAAGTGASGPAR